MADFYDFDKFQLKPHFDDFGNLKGFTQKDFLGNKSYFDKNMKYKGLKVKDSISGKSEYYDASYKFLGKTTDFKGPNFLKSDGTFGYTPKMFDIKDPNFHSDIHKHFSGFRANLLNKIY